MLSAVERRLSNDEIADQFHVSKRTVESHIAALRRKLGASSRTDLIEWARRQRSAGIQRPGNSFVGRSRDIAAVAELLSSSGWVTVTGPPGSGKSRLAIEIAAVSQRTPVLVSLGQTVSDDIVSIIATALNLADGSASSALLAACAEALHAADHLLIIDDCDRFADQVGATLVALTAGAPRLSVLVTCRSAVGHGTEVVYQLGPLPTHADDGGAAQLFLERARSAAPGVQFARTDMFAIDRCCERLGGLPLAIELAAARLRHLSLSELEDHLDRGIDLLERTDGSGRQASVEAAIAWTWELLDDEDRQVLECLAALPRSFDVELVEAIDSSNSASAVVRLLDRSLVAHTLESHEPRRFRVLEPIRAFVGARTDPSRVAAIRAHHAQLHARRAHSLARRIRFDHSAVPQARALIPDTAAALQWSIATDPELACRLAGSLAVVIEHAGTDATSLAAITRAARSAEVQNHGDVTDLCDAGYVLCYIDLSLAGELAAVASARAVGDAERLAALHLTGLVLAYQGRPAEAMPYLDNAVELAARRHDQWFLASTQQARAMALKRDPTRDPDDVIAAFRLASETYALAGDTMHAYNCRYMMAATAADNGCQIESALQWIESCATYAREQSNRHELAHAILVEIRLKPMADAESRLRDVLDMFTRVGDLRCVTRSQLLLSDHVSGAERIRHLEHAARLAADLADTVLEVTAIERLVTAHWSTGAGAEAAIAFGRLISMIGSDDAVKRLPPSMRDRLEQFEAEITAGRSLSSAKRASR